jgi:hypothetical protein
MLYRPKIKGINAKVVKISKKVQSLFLPFSAFFVVFPLSRRYKTTTLKAFFKIFNNFVSFFSIYSICRVL